MHGSPVAIFFGMPGHIELAILGFLLVSAVVAVIVVAMNSTPRSRESLNPNLWPCPDCGRSVSKLATVCPQCGRPLS